VRLGGLHALERLAQTNPPQRQTIVDVICAYLRMPYIPPDDQAPGEDAPDDVHARYEQRRQELQVRLTAQRILSAHLNPEAAEVFWADTDLNLTEAHLHQFDLAACHVRSAQFEGATFTGIAGFRDTKFAGTAEFGGGTFAGYARFAGAEFAGTAGFGGVTFARNAWFAGATFAGTVAFLWAEFTGTAGFRGAKFAEYARFDRAKFVGDAWFDWATFTADAGFGKAEFTGDAGFRRATFAGHTEFDGARVAPSSRLVALPIGWTTRPVAEGEEEGWLYMVRDEDSGEQPTKAPGDGPA